MSKKNKKEEAAEAVETSQEALNPTTETVEAATEEAPAPEVEEPKKSKKSEQTLEQKITDALQPYVGVKIDSVSASSIKVIVGNILGSDARYSINKDGSIAVQVGEALLTVKKK